MIVSQASDHISHNSKVIQPTTSSDMEWRRSGERGSAFRGLTKPRGASRGGGRSGRGQAAGRGAPGSEKIDKPLTSSPATVKVVTSPPPDPVPSSQTSKQKAPKKLLTPDPEISLNVLSLQPPKSPNRRRRSHQHNKVSNSASNPVMNRHLTTERTGRKALTGPPTPSTPSQDLPSPSTPNSGTPSLDIRNNIDAFVERARAVAMDGSHTPGSHIDWAGTDDDSLPDLDDWGVPSSKGGSVQDEEKISPIVEDKELSFVPKSPLDKAVDSTSATNKPPLAIPVSEMAPRPHKVERVRSKRGNRSRGNSRAQQVSPVCKPEIKQSSSINSPVLAPNNGTLSPAPAPLCSVKSAPPSPQNLVKLPLHPSLPAKPVTSIEPVRTRGQDKAATPMRNVLPPKHASKAAEDILIKVEEPSVQKITTPAVPEAESVPKEEITVLVPLQETVHNSNFAGLRAPNLAHSRARTLGQVGDIQIPPYAPSSSPFNSLLTDCSPPKSAGLPHTRTHSSPEANGFARASHVSRPVLTGDAISRLAKTLNTSRDVSPRREPITFSTASN